MLFHLRLIRQPNGVRSVKKCRAIQQGAIRKIRTWDNRHSVQPIPDAAHVTHRVFRAEVGRKLELHSNWLKECSFSSRDRSATLSRGAISRTRDFAVLLARSFVLPRSR